MQPETRYARSGDVSIAYQVLGDGPFDLVFVPGTFSHVELVWNVPSWAAFYERLAGFSRLIMIDKRGGGMSDRIAGAPTLETRMDDLRAVMDAAGSERAALLGISEGGPMSILFAATYPDRAAALILYGAFARELRAPDYPWGWNEEDWVRASETELRRWGDPDFMLEMVDSFWPSATADDRAGILTLIRQGLSPGAMDALNRMNMQIDVRSVLPSIRVPTLVLHRRADPVTKVEAGRYLAERIPGASIVEFDGVDHVPFSNGAEEIAEQIETFLRDVWESGSWERVEPERVLSTVLFTDIVDSTAKATELGDAAWRKVLQEHHAVIRRQLVRFRGKEVDTAGDGFFASFDGPARAIRCACAITDSIKELGLEVKAGLHTGECELVDGKVAGIAVHTGARVAAHAQPSEVLVSQTVKDLVAGSGLAFQDRGWHELKGIPGEWRLFAVSGFGGSA